MSEPDLRLLRALAGPEFRRADTLRDERRAESLPAFERWLRNLAAWLPVSSESAASIARLNAAVLKHELSALSDADVTALMQQQMALLKADGLDSEALPAVFACIGEASRRRLGMWPHPVQFSGVRLLLSGHLAEMRTGEGKSLVAALAAVAMAASGAAVHVVSTNDYLAERDCQNMQPLFAYFGLTGGVVKGGMESPERRAAYRCDICFVSGKELVFDYLKDRLAGHGVLPARVSGLQQLLRHGGVDDDENQPLIPALHFAIVDEADSVLIDEARTPMIISRESPGLYEPALLGWAIAAARGLAAGVDFSLSPAREVELKPDALSRCPPLPEGVRPVWRARHWRELVLRQALQALYLFERDQHYILVEGKVQIVDESTGRVMADRSWEQGLHQLIETKEGLALTAGRDTLSRMTFQRFFRRYYLLAGLTGTAAESARELWRVYRLRVRRVPTHRPVQRQVLPALCLADAAAKWRAVADEAATLAARGQAVLVGTRSVEASEAVAAEFAARGLVFVVLNARQDADEAAVVAAAGAAGRITIATNMAGRGTDIKLDPVARAAGGLHVILTEFHEAPRVDRQLFGRSARQGELGSVRAIVARDDGLFKGLPAALPLSVAVYWAQAAAERRAYVARMQTLKQDQDLNRMIGIAGRVV